MQMGKLWRGWFAATVAFELSHLDNYFDHLGDHLRRDVRDLETRFKDDLKTADPEEENIRLLEDWYADQAYEIDEVFPELLYRSFLITLCSVVEHNLVRLCIEVSRRRGAPPFTPPHGKILVTCAAYLAKTLNGGFPQSKEWERVRTYYAIRNQLVHSGKNIAKKPLPVAAEELLDSTGALKVHLDTDNNVTYREIVVTQALCDLARKDVRGFFDQVVKTWNAEPAGE